MRMLSARLSSVRTRRMAFIRCGSPNVAAASSSARRGTVMPWMSRWLIAQ